MKAKWYKTNFPPKIGLTRFDSSFHYVNKSFLQIFLFTVAPLISHAAFQDQTSFLNAIGTNVYTESFNGGSGSIVSGPLSFSQGPLVFTVTSSSGPIFIGNGLISTSVASDSLLVAFTSGNVDFFGFNVFGTDSAHNYQPTVAALTFNFPPASGFSAPIGALNSTTFSETYLGLDDLLGSISMTFSAFSLDSTERFVALDNITIGSMSPIPEPSAYAWFLSFGAITVFTWRRFRKPGKTFKGRIQGADV